MARNCVVSHVLIAFALAFSTVLPMEAGVSAARQEPAGDGLAAGLPEGFEVSVLAEQAIEDSTGYLNGSDGMGGNLIIGRIPLPPQANMDDVLLPGGPANASDISMMHSSVHGGMQLMYVETGQAVVEQQGSASTYSQGDNVLIPPGTTANVYNDSTTECTSILTLVFAVGAAGQPPESAVTGPLACGEPEILYSLVDASWPTVAARLFIATLTLAPQTGVYESMHTGPLVMHVDSGAISVDSGIAMAVPTGTWMGVHSGAPYDLYGVGDQAASVLVAGLVAADRPLFVPYEERALSPDIEGGTAAEQPANGGADQNSYTSPTFGYSISWDPSVWVIQNDAETSTGRLDELYLEAPTGPLWITGTTEYDGDVTACLEAEATLRDNPEEGITNWTLATNEQGSPLTGTSPNAAWGIYTNVYTDPGDPAATPTPFVDYINCVSVGDGEAVIIFYTFSEREAYNEHIGYVLQLVDQLVLP